LTIVAALCSLRLRTASLETGETTCGLISTLGFLVRDFKRSLSEGTLSPAPFLFHYKRAAKKARTGLCRDPVPKEQEQGRDNGALVQSPRPEGVSGGPMLDTVKLHNGLVANVGVFTDYKKGQRTGVRRKRTKGNRSSQHSVIRWLQELITPGQVGHGLRSATKAATKAAEGARKTP
jgi:hypothetical protein